MGGTRCGFKAWCACVAWCARGWWTLSGAAALARRGAAPGLGRSSVPRAEAILSMPGFVTEADMRPFLADLLGMGFAPEAEVLGALKQANGNRLGALEALQGRQPSVLENRMRPAVAELMEMGFGPEARVQAALEQRPQQ